MRNDDTRPACHDTLQCFLYQRFGFAVEVAGGFVEDEDLRVFEDQSCQRDALLFVGSKFWQIQVVL
jgi:hypothetical protein